MIERFKRGRVVLELRTDPQGETIEIAMPLQVKVLVYYSITRGRWISKISAVAKDVASPGNTDYFGDEWTHEKRPTREKIAEQVTGWLGHEIAEQLGLNPHEAR